MPHQNRLASYLNSSVFQVMATMAENLALVPLDWEISTYKSQVVVEGHPRRAGDIRATAHWAAALGMTEYNDLDGKLPRAWYLQEGPWHIDIVASLATSLSELTPVDMRVRRTKLRGSAANG